MKSKKLGLFNPKLPDILRQHITSSIENRLDQFVKEVMLWLRQAVLDKWGPLEPEYDERGKPLPQPPFILTPEQYLSCVVPQKSVEGDRITISLQFQEGIHEPSGYTFEELHRIREYGSAELKVPAAPVWRPLKLRFQSRMKGFQTRFQESLQQAGEDTLKEV